MAPASARAKAEAEYGVSFEYPNLSLHSAAANGNIGLVKYALSNGQPANSVLNGVLPIHAAAAGGHEDVVRMLIENGASVDAPRLSRRYMTDKTRSASLTLGTAGSTPLHFAAANGHIGVIELLLACGAKPDCTEKLGKTPEHLALEQDHSEVADLLRTATANFREGAIDDATDEEHSNRAHSPRHGVHKSPKSPLVGPVTNRPFAYRLGSSPSSASLRSTATTGSVLGIHGRRLLANRRSSESLASQAAAAIKERMSGRHSTPRRQSLAHHAHSPGMVRQNSDPAAPTQPRRPSLPAVFDKASQTARHALGMTSSDSAPRPPPLHLGSHTFTQPRLRAGSGSSRSLASVFTRKTHGNSASALDMDEADSILGSPTVVSPISEHGPSGQYAVWADEGHNDDRSSTLLAPANPSHQVQTAPPGQGSFSSSEASGSTAGALIHSNSFGSLSLSSGMGYRPRKSSALSSPGQKAGASREDPASGTADQAEAGILHRRASSSNSNKARSFFGKLSRASSTHSALSENVKPLVSAQSDMSDQSNLESTVSDAGTSGGETVEADSGEAGDRFPGQEPPNLRGKASSRSRGDSVGSTSSSASRATGALSPRSAGSADHLHPGEYSERLIARTRANRSNSAATDPDLRQVALGNAVLASSSTNASFLSGSPASVSSVEPFSTQSAHSTAPSSAIWSAASTHDSKDRSRSFKTRSPVHMATGAPRTPTGEIITPALASSMVRRAEQQLMSFDPNSAEGASRPSLSEQLAAYGESLAVERQAKRAAQRPGHSTAAPMPYSWEKVGKDGTRVPVSRSERLTEASHLGLGLHRGPSSAFQQGPLDRRRPSAPTLRQDHKLSMEAPIDHALVHAPSSLRYETVHTPRGDQKSDGNTLGAAAQRIYDNRATGLSEKSKDVSASLHRASPDNTLLSPASMADTRRRKSVDRRSRTPETIGSANSSGVEAPRTPRAPQATLSPPVHARYRPGQVTPQIAAAEANELELERTNSILSMQGATPIAPSTVDGNVRNGRVKRFMHALTGNAR